MVSQHNQIASVQCLPQFTFARVLHLMDQTQLSIYQIETYTVQHYNLFTSGNPFYYFH